MKHKRLKDRFKCPCCGTKIPYRNFNVFKKDFLTECPFCLRTLIPKKVKTYNKISFGVGLASVIIPGYIYINYFHPTSLLKTLCIAGSGAVLVFIADVIYIYSTVEFEELDPSLK